MIEQKVLPIVLPAASAPQADVGRSTPVTVLADGTVRLGEKPVEASTLLPEIRMILEKDIEARFVLRADRSVEYGRVVQVLNVLRKAGVQRLSIAVEPVP